MLKNLIIKNFVLIRHLELSPDQGFNIITGETGAGKSILLGAIGLLMGNRADTKVLWDENEKCVIEATFDIQNYQLQDFFLQADLDYENLCVVRREINSSNKSRAFINDTPVNLDTLKNLGSFLLNIHSQHETLLLAKSGFQLSILDAYAENDFLLSEYRTLYRRHKNLESQLEEKENLLADRRKQQEFNQFLANELKEAALQNGEQEKMEEELKQLENAEDIKLRLHEYMDSMDGNDAGVLPALNNALKTLDYLSRFSSQYSGLKERLESCYYELKDIADEVSSKASLVEINPEELARIQDRLNLLYSLQKKHGAKTTEGLIEILHELENNLSETGNLEEEIQRLRKESSETRQQLAIKADQLHENRKRVAPLVVENLTSLLKEVGIPEAGVVVKQEKKEPGADGADNISILFSANKGIAPQELRNAASGGEFSRLMLCIKHLLAVKTSLPTLIFDEIDTGISGEVAIKVGKIMKEMSSKHQVIAISHLPQIAAMGDAHYFVYKDSSDHKTSSMVKKLNKEERVMEVAQMIGGEKPSETAIENARELLLRNV